MREIKFRAWLDMWKDGRLQMHYDGFGIDIGTGKLFHNIGNPLGLREYPRDAIIMQYTGLKDEYDKEIYEGDIIREFKLRSIIEWHSDYSSFGFYKPTSYGRSFQSFRVISTKDIEIIGNIHQNHELLTQLN